MPFTYSHAWTLSASPAGVFRALTDEAALVEWFAEGAQVEQRVGGVYRFWGRHALGTPPQDAARQTISRFEPDALLAYEWPINEVDTDVVMRLAPVLEGTTLLLTHNVWGDIKLPNQEEVVSDFWRTAMDNLAAHLEGRDDITMPDYFARGQARSK